MGEPVLWRVGRRVPKNVYRGDEIAGQFQREEWAHQAVEALNRLETQIAEMQKRADAYAERYGTAKR